MIVELPVSRLAEYAAVPIAYRVARRLVPGVEPNTYREVGVMPTYDKDYDLLGETPLDWSSRFDLAQWGIFVARRDGEIVGGIAVAPPGDVMRGMELPSDAAVIWDIRVAPASRGQHVGAALFNAARTWASQHGYSGLVAETQDINVSAAHFYAKMGCSVLTYEPGVYEGLPDEARVIFHCP